MTSGTCLLERNPDLFADRSTDLTDGFDRSLGTAVRYASSLLTLCLVDSLPLEMVEEIQSILEYNMYQYYAPFWDPKRPKRGSLRRSLTFSLSLSNGYSLPPGPMYPTCITADIQWFEWMALLGEVDIDFFVDPGCISCRRHIDDKTIVLWAADWGPDDLEPGEDEDDGMRRGDDIPYWLKMFAKNCEEARQDVD